jgi:hypothetical protein
MRKKLLILLFAALFFVLGSGVAQAAPGTIRTCTSIGSSSYIWTKFNGGQEIAVHPGQCAGEGTGILPYYEPFQMYIGPGWCVAQKVNSGPAYTYAGAAGTGSWWTVHPGNGFTGTWALSERAWDC